MGFDYSGIANTALTQIEDKGRDVSVIYKTTGTYDAGTDAITGASETTVVMKAVLTDFNKNDIPGTLVDVGDQLALIAASGITKPRVGDKVLDTVDYTIMNILDVTPGNTPLLYKLQLRK